MNNLPEEPWGNSSADVDQFIQELKVCVPSTASQLQKRIFYELGKRAAAVGLVPSTTRSSRLTLERIGWGTAVGMAFCLGLFLTHGSPRPADSPQTTQVAVNSPARQSQHVLDRPASKTATEVSLHPSAALPERDVESYARLDRVPMVESSRPGQALNAPAQPKSLWDWWGQDMSRLLAYHPREPWTESLPESTPIVVARLTGPATRAEIVSEFVTGTGSPLSVEPVNLLRAWFTNN